MIQEWVREGTVVNFLVVPHLDLIFQMISNNIFRPLPKLIDATAPL